MKLLEQMVVSDGKVYENNVLKVDSFLNHQIDPTLMVKMAEVLANYFKNDNITKVLTIEASGIAPAILVANILNVPMLFAKKSVPSTLNENSFYQAKVYSYTKNVTKNIIVSKDYLTSSDNVLIIDDFLANGQAVLGLLDIISQANATASGVGILVEKSFQSGRKIIEEKDIKICSLCRLKSLDNGEVKFNKADDEVLN